MVEQPLHQQLSSLLVEQARLNRELRRNRIFLRLARDGYRQASSCEDESALVRNLLHILLKAGLLDAVALLNYQQEHWQAISQLGHWPDILPAVDCHRATCFWQQGQELPAALSTLTANHFQRLAWVVNGEWALLMGLRNDSGLNLQLQDDEAPFLESLLAVITDLLQRFRLAQQTKGQTTLDSLTGLPNRLLAFDRLQQALISHEHQDGHVMVLFADLERFKDINDRCGHLVGDQLLAAVARRWRATLRPADTLARMGSDQFLVILERASKPKTAEVVAQKLLDCLAQPFTVAGQRLQVNATIGIAMYPEDSHDVSELIRNADAARVQARDNDDTRYRFFTPAMNRVLQRRLTLERALSQAIENKEFRLLYQPKLDTKTGHVTGVEALIRWYHPQLGAVSPEQFIGLAEEDGQILAIGQWVLH